MLDTTYNIQKMAQAQAQQSAKQRLATSSNDEPTAGIDFKTIMADANSTEQMRQEQEKAATKDGKLRIGETDNDKMFREQLQKLSGKKQKEMKNELDREDFLNLMVTQMKNQDPTKPMDNQQMATQLAQFNSVEQLVNVNTTLSNMNQSQKSGDARFLTQFIGKEVNVNSNQFRIGPTGPVNTLSALLPAPAAQLGVKILNEEGAVVKKLNLGSHDTGRAILNFDGKDEEGRALPSGQYSLVVEANTTDGKPLQAKSVVSALVTGVTDLGSGGKLETSAGPVAVGDIDAVRLPDAPKPNSAAIPAKNEPVRVSEKSPSAPIVSTKVPTPLPQPAMQ